MTQKPFKLIRKTEKVRLYNGDCNVVMKALIQKGILLDSIVTDPPYGISFMNHEWDSPDSLTGMVGYISGTNETKERKGAFAVGKGSNSRGYADVPMQKFQTWTTGWAKRAFKLLKPGGYMISFCGARTYHRMVRGIEDAGFELVDHWAWIYGSGMPKRGDIAKGIDRVLGKKGKTINARKIARKRETDKTFIYDTNKGSMFNNEVEAEIGTYVPATPEAKRWSGWSTQLKPSFEPIIVARRPGTPFFDLNPDFHFYYSSKAGKADRDGSDHPTVKPFALMKALVQQVTPEGGLVMDPFSGSGSTIAAALHAGYRAIGIELDRKHVKDIDRRITRYYDDPKVRLNTLFG